MSSTCAEPSLPTSASGLWLSVFTPVLLSVLQSAEAGKVGRGALGRAEVT